MKKLPIGIQTFQKIREDDYVYVDKTEQKALALMKTKGYAEKYKAKGKKIILIGIGFSSEEKNVTDFLWEEV